MTETNQDNAERFAWILQHKQDVDTVAAASGLPVSILDACPNREWMEILAQKVNAEDLPDPYVGMNVRDRFTALWHDQLGYTYNDEPDPRENNND